MDHFGLLSPIKARPKNNSQKYELIFGHRRVRAAKYLKWESIPAEIEMVSDEQMLNFSLAENLSRADLSDYEKALSYHRMHMQFGKKYEEIAKISGCSKQRISNYVRMVHL